MIFVGFFKWWYLEGWRIELRRVFERIRWINDRLSTTILLRTLFKPWKQTVSHSVSGVSMQGRMQVWLGNQVSRLVGFSLRMAFLVVGVIGSVGLLIYGFLVVLVWPLLPFLVIVLPVIGFLL